MKKLTKKDMIDKILEFKKAEEIVDAAKELDIDIDLETAKAWFDAVRNPDFNEADFEKDLEELNGGCGPNIGSSDDAGPVTQVWS